MTSSWQFSQYSDNGTEKWVQVSTLVFTISQVKPLRYHWYAVSLGVQPCRVMAIEKESLPHWVSPIGDFNITFNRCHRSHFTISHCSIRLEVTVGPYSGVYLFHETLLAILLVSTCSAYGCYIAASEVWFASTVSANSLFKNRPKKYEQYRRGRCISTRHVMSPLVSGNYPLRL